MKKASKLTIKIPGGIVRKLIMITTILFLLNASSLYAETGRFETLSDGMLEALTSEQSQSVNLKIEFDVDSDKIRKSSHPILLELSKALNHRLLTTQKIVIKGHTDSDGSAEYNKKLSKKRAMAVKAFLELKSNISPQRLKPVGCGEEFPLLPNTSPANKQKNRRVEIQVDPESQSNTEHDPFNSEGDFQGF